MSRVDKTITNAYYEFDIDEKTMLPKRIRVTVMTGRRGLTEKKAGRIVGGEHVVFRFSYSLRNFGKVDDLKIPTEAGKLLTKRR